MAGEARHKVTRAILRQRLSIFNPHNLSEATGGQPYIGYTPADRGHLSFAARWRVYRPGYQTDPKAHFLDNGNKTFEVHHKGEKNDKLAEAIHWANEHYHNVPYDKAWERSLFGSYHPLGTMEKIEKMLKTGGKS